MEIKVERTLVKSEPELRELLRESPELRGGGVRVFFSEKGFGTQVALTARAGSGVAESDLEGILDGLAEPRKRPFSAA
jgi:hypothetical protein